MSLKQSIVVRSEFTRPTPEVKPGSGSRGGTPGNYVTGYMAREQFAAEPIAPVRKGELDGFATNYMARATAVETLLSSYRSADAVIEGAPRTSAYDAPTLAGRRLQRSVERARRRGVVGPRQLKQDMRKAQGSGGVAFGHNGVALSHEQLHADSAEIQALFDKGHTVLKTILSFEHSYLVEQGVVPADMVGVLADGRADKGAYRGQVDQLKLRMAIMEGMEKLGRIAGFDELKYVAVIQVDTRQTHCHLAIVEAGEGRRRLARDGTQRGKLNEREKALIRRGTDGALQRYRSVSYFSSAVGYQRRSVSAYVKRWAYDSLSVSTRAQFVLACLPSDRRLWRAASNRTEMSKANRLVRDLVEDHLRQAGSPMPQAMAEVHKYATERMRKEGLSTAEYDRLVAAGREKIITQAMNGVYTVLSAVADDELVVNTPIMESMSIDREELIEALAARPDEPQAGDLDPGYFALRLRSYSERLHRHGLMRDDFRARASQWEIAEAAGKAAPGSRSMYEFYLTEAEYHAKLVSKYQHYLDLGLAKIPELREQWQAVEDYGHALTGLRALRKDTSLPKMKSSKAAEELGRELYGQPGGRHLAATGAEGAAGRALLDSRIEAMSERYAQMSAELINRWEQEGLAVRVRAIDPDETPDADEEVLHAGSQLPRGAEPAVGMPEATVVISAQPGHDFEEVKGLDMHELGMDWSRDQRVGQRTAARFAELGQRRADAATGAREWLVATGQSAEVDAEMGEALTDIDSMNQCAESVTRDGILPSDLARALERMAARREEAARERRRCAMAARAAEAAAVEADLEPRAPKPLGRTTRVDTGIGGVVNESVDAIVADFNPSIDTDDMGLG